MRRLLLSSADEIAQEDLQFPAHGGANGIYDMIMALKWISDNILAFGGDHNRVTVFGSGLGGGLGVCSLVVSPWSGSLFDRAVISSGACNGPWGPWTQEDSERNSEALMKHLDSIDLKQMRALPAESLLCHQHDYGRPDAPMQCSIDYASDGWVIPSQPSELYSKDGPTIEFDVMLGATTQDTLAAPPWDLGKRPKTLTELRTMLTNITKSAATTERIVKTYANRSSAAAWMQISSDVCSVCPTLWLADDISTSAHGGGPTPYLYQCECTPQRRSAWAVIVAATLSDRDRCCEQT